MLFFYCFSHCVDFVSRLDTGRPRSLKKHGLLCSVLTSASCDPLPPEVPRSSVIREKAQGRESGNQWTRTAQAGPSTSSGESIVLAMVLPAGISVNKTISSFNFKEFCTGGLGRQTQNRVL